MVRAAVVYGLLVAAFFLLAIFSNQPNKNISAHSRRHGPGRRIVLRNLNQQQQQQQQKKPENASSSHAAFDPIVADIEWRRENREWEREHFQNLYQAWEKTNNTNSNSVNEDPHPQQQQNHHQQQENHHQQQDHRQQQDHQSDHHHDAQGEEHQPTPWDDEYQDSEEYLNDESHFNISNRLEVLFPLLDVNPKDNFVSLSELQDWHVQQAEKLAMQRVKREFDARDRNHDGVISIHEYLPQFSAEELANGSTEHGQPGWWREHFELADVGGDGGLNQTEFADFLHPEDGRNPKLREWLRKEQIRENDHDKDGKLSLEEFDHVFDVMRYYGEDLSHLHQGNDAEARKEKFHELDENKDGFLTEDELEPVMSRLHPGEAFYARQQADYLIQQADEDKDGRLTLKEMLEHPYAFYSTAYTPEEWPEDIDHDEFR